jgi:hypothetical protein
MCFSSFESLGPDPAEFFELFTEKEKEDDLFGGKELLLEDDQEKFV